MIIPLMLATTLAAGDGTPPKGKALAELVSNYLAADAKRQAEMRRNFDAEMAPLKPGKDLDKLREELLKIASDQGKKLRFSQRIGFLDEDKRTCKYIVEGKPGRILVIGLHSGGAGVGDAESAAAAMGGGDWFWLFPEVLAKTEFAWTELATEEFVLKLIEEAKRTGKVDPNRIYITGHGMGGYGAWMLGAHHADVFAGAAAFAGAPSPIMRSATEVAGIADGVIPNLHDLPLHFYQSLDDTRVPPATNIFANQELKRWRAQHPGGFEFQYVEVNGRGHGAPVEGYQPALEWMVKHERVARPKKFLWQPVLDSKHQFYWLYWQKPRRGAIVQVEAKADNIVLVTNLNDPKDSTGMTMFLGEPLVDLAREVTVIVNGRERYRGFVPRTFSTLLLTLTRNDAQLLFDARYDL